MEKALDLFSMQVDRQYAVHADRHHHVGHDLRCDGDPGGTHAAILASVAEVGHHRRDTGCGCPAQGINHHYQLHQVVVGGGAGGLQNEDVFAAHVLVEFHGRLAVTETAHVGFAQR